MRRLNLLVLFLCALTLPAFAQFSNVPVTGFNADIVADGAVGVGSLSTTASADIAVPPYVFVSTTFNPGSGICATGATAMPASLTITSTNTTTNTGITYSLQSYGNGTATNNNVLQLAVNASGTLTLTTPISAAKLYLVCLGGSGASTFTAVVNFSDATSQTITNSPAAPDWCGGAATYRLTAQQYYRINNNSATCNGAGCQYLYEIPVEIAASNYSKTITSVSLTNNTTGTLLNIFAVGAQAPCASPLAQPTALVLTPSSTSQIGGSFTAATGSPTGYLVVRYPQGSATTTPIGGTVYTAGQALGLGTVVSFGTNTTITDPGLNGGTAYTYYVYSYNGGTTCGGPVYQTISPLTATQSTNACGTLTGVVPVGPGLPNTPAGGFTSLTQALAYISANGLGGNTTLALQTGYDGTSANETFPITFTANPCVSVSRTLTIRPATGVTGLSITNSSSAAPIIDFSGCSYITIDGVNNGLTISNTSTAATANTSTIRFINDANNNAVVNCSVLGSSTGALATNTGNIYFATGTTNGNDNNSIVNCKIGPAGANLPSKGVYAQGSTSNATIANSGIIIASNEIYDFFLTDGCAGLYALTGNTDWTIASNKVFQTSTRTFTVAGTMNGIYFSNGTYGQNIQITANTIGYTTNNSTGTMTLTGTVAGAFVGIYFNSLTTATLPSSINGNTISDISLTSSSGIFNGIQNVSGASSNTININGNQIKNIATTNTTGTITAILWTSATNMNILGNTINNITRTGAGTTYGLYSGSSSINENISNNTISNIVSTATGASTFYGIYQNTLSGIKTFQNNNIFNFSGQGGTTMYGMRIGYGSTIDISGNTIYNLNSTGGTGGSVYGISTGTSGTTFNVHRNKIYNLSMSSTGGVIYGLYNSTSVVNMYNNLVGDLSSTAYTSTSSPYMGVFGVYIASGNSNIYNNTIRIGTVTSSGTNFSAAGIFASTTPTVLLQNNLVVNLATPTGLGKAVAYQRSSTTLGSYAAASATNSFYAGTPGANNLIFWDGTNAHQTLAAYQTAVAPRDAYTFNHNPTFISTTGSDPTFLHLASGVASPLESSGTIVGLFSVDYDGQARPGPAGSTFGGATNFDIGADEFDAIPSFSCSLPTPGNTIATPATICFGGSTTLSLQNATLGNAVTYQWFSSTDNVTYAPVANATAATLTVSPTAVTYYKATVTCGGTLVGNSTPVLIAFTNMITGSTPGVRCGTGTLNLTATASSGTIKWYDVATGGFALGTGSPFTTPSIAASTNYYVGAETVAPGTITMGTGTTAIGTSSYPNPLSGFYGGTKHQLLYLASELTAQGMTAGNITSVSFDLATVNAASACNDFTIRLGTTNATALTGFVTGTVTAYNATYTPSSTGIVTFTLTTPYSWDGTSNLILETVHNAGNGGNGSGTTHRYTTTPFNSVYVRYQDAVTPAGVASFDASTGGSVSAYANRPNVIFGGQKVCSSPRVQVPITINTAPVFTITTDKTVCNTATTPITVTSNVAAYNNYVWTPATNLFTNAAGTTPYVAGSSATTVYFKSTTPGVAAYTATATNTTTLCGAVATMNMTVLPATVTATATPGSICVTGTTTFDLSPATGYGAGSFQWQSSTTNIPASFVDVLGATSATYTTPVTTTSTYYRVTIKDGSGILCLNSVSDTARVYNPLIVSTTPAERCGPGSVTLGATATEGVLNWYAAASGGAALSTGGTFTTPSLTANTTYYVSAAAGGASGIATIGAGAATTDKTTFEGTSPYAYHYGNYKHQMLITATELYAAGISPGTITSLGFDVAVAGSPVAAFNNFNVTLIPSSLTALTSTFATGGTPVFSAASVTPAVGINTYNFTTPFTWDGTSNIIVQTCYNNNNSGANASGAEVKYDVTSYISHNIYRVDGTQNTVCDQATGNASNDGPITSKRPKMILGYNGSCESPRTAVVATIKAVPTASVTPAGPVAICAGNTTTLTASGGTTYQWRNAGGNIAGATNAAYTTGVAGNYRVVVANTSGCSDTSAVVAVSVNPLPTVFIGNDTTFCSGNTLTLNAGNTGSTFLWNNNTTAQTRNVTTTGTYSVKVTNANGCFKSDTIVVTVRPTPNVNLGNDTNICLGINYTLNAGNPGASYLWDNGTIAQTRTINNTGTYYVKVTNGFNCSRSDTVSANYLTSPIVDLGNDIDACAGTPVVLNAGNPGETYLWDNGTTAQTRSVTTSGNYYVTVRNIANCKGSDTVAVVVHPLPIVNLGNDTTFCYGETLTLNAGNQGSSYLWNNNSTNQTLAASVTGNYSVTVTTGFGCVGTDNINIVVKDPPSGLINAVYSDSATYWFNVLNPQYVTGYIWNFGDGSPTVMGNLVSHTYTQNGVFNVTVNLIGECTDSIGKSRTVDVFDANGGGTSVRNIKDENALALYPNPAREYITLENKSNLAMEQVSVYNVLGQLLIAEKADTKDKHILQTAKLPSGIYTIRIETNKGMIVRKFEIMK